MHTGKYHVYISHLIVAFVFAGIFLAYSQPMSAGDPFWHLNNGRWIVENKMLPSVDHFMHTASPEPSPKKTFVLQSYWLSQSLMYLIYKAAGFHGIVAAKALVFTLMFYVLYLCLRVGGMGWVVSAAAVAPVALILRTFGEPRPQVFSFLMCVTVFYLLEKGVRNRGEKPALIFRMLLPLSMALWSNLHGGFIIGIGMIVIYMIPETLRFIRCGRDGDRRQTLVGPLWLLGSIVATGLNPCGLKAVVVMFSDPFVNMITEYRPTLQLLWELGMKSQLIGMVTLWVAAAAVLALSWRRVKIEHIMLFLVFGGAGCLIYRFSAFSVLISTAVAGQYLKGIVPVKLAENRTLARAIPPAALLMGIWVMSIALGSGNILKGAVITNGVPRDAVSAIRVLGLPGELFNPYEWGGYIGWRLFPEYRVFVDGRAIDLKAHLDYDRAMYGDLGVLDSRGVNTVIFYTYIPRGYGGEVPKLIFGLLKDESWGLAYYDDFSAVFVRYSALKRRIPMIGKELLWDKLVERLIKWAEVAPSDYRPHVALGMLYAEKGLREKADESLKRSMSLMPGNPEAVWVANKYGIWPKAGVK